MKMRWYDHVLVSLSGVVLAALGVCVILAAGGVIALPEPFAFDTWLGTGWQWMPILFLAGLLLIAWGIWLVIRPFIRQYETHGKYYSVKSGEEGGVHISVQALDHLVHKCLSKWDAILSSHVKITGQEDAMHIVLRATLRSDVRIPELVEKVRVQIKEYVEQCAGVKVESVKIIVEATKEGRGQQHEDMPEPAPDPVRQLDAPSDTATLEMNEVISSAPQDQDAPGAQDTQSEQAEKQDSAPPEEPKIVASSVDFGPDEPLPVSLSSDAFPFPGELSEQTAWGQPEEGHTEEDEGDV